MGFYEKIKKGLSKTKSAISGTFNSMTAAFVKVDSEVLDELLEALIISDAGYENSEEIIGELERRAKTAHIRTGDELKEMLCDILASRMTDENMALKLDTRPSVILVVGVNGAGKTTSIGKLASILKQNGKSVIVGAADTFRAAAIEQLEEWCLRAGVQMISQGEGADPSSVVYNTIAAAKARNSDVIIIDTAGRLHNKKNLMDELSKIRKVIGKELGECDCEVLLVLDGTTGQNGIAQAKEFAGAAGVTGIVITKLDGTAKGGMALSVKRELGIPVKLIGVGEKIDDMNFFVPEDFARALLD